MNKPHMENEDRNDPETSQQEPKVAGSISPDDAPAGESSDIASLQSKLDKVTADLESKHDQWMRSQAELENFRRRTQKELAEARQYQALPVVREILPGIDNLRRAVEAAQKGGSAEEMIEGVGMVLQQFERILESQGVKPIETTDATFDPSLHEAIQQFPVPDKPPMTILQDVERGYTLHDRVVRPAKVIVSMAPPESAGGESEPGESEPGESSGDAE